MTIDSQTDPQLAAVAGLVRGAITADLGADFITTVYDDPRALQVLAAGKLPALCIYRANERRRLRNSAAHVSDITVQFDYVLPATSLERRGARWPALSAVWEKISDVVIEGKHAAVSSGASVLETAGLFVEHDNTAQVEYSLADGGGENYPFFRGRIVLPFTPEDVDVATLADFLQFQMTFDKPPDAPVDGEALIVLNVTLPAYGS